MPTILPPTNRLSSSASVTFQRPARFAMRLVSSRIAIGAALAVLFSCSTPEPTAPPRSVWYARGLEIALTAKDETELKGRMAIEIVRLTDPFSENAKLTREERAAAIRDLADGWTEGLKRKESAK